MVRFQILHQDLRETQCLTGDENHWVKKHCFHTVRQKQKLEIKTNEQLPHQWTAINVYFPSALQLNPNFCSFNPSFQTCFYFLNLPLCSLGASDDSLLLFPIAHPRLITHNLSKCSVHTANAGLFLHNQNMATAVGSVYLYIHEFFICMRLP